MRPGKSNRLYAVIFFLREWMMKAVLWFTQVVLERMDVPANSWMFLTNGLAGRLNG